MCSEGALRTPRKCQKYRVRAIEYRIFILKCQIDTGLERQHLREWLRGRASVCSATEGSNIEQTPFIEIASVWFSIHITILHLYASAGHLRHCPPFLQMHYYLSLEVSVSSRRRAPLHRAAIWPNGTFAEEISIDSYSSGSRHKSRLPPQALRTNTRNRWLTNHGWSQLFALLPYPIPAAFLFLTLPLCTSASLTPDPVSQSAAESGHPVPTSELLFLPFSY